MFLTEATAMDWALVVTNRDLGQPAATDATVRELLSRLRRDDLIGFVLRLLGALNAEKEARYETVNRRFMVWAGQAASDAMRLVRQRDARANWVLIEPWQQLLMLQNVLRYSPADGAVALESPEGKAAFLSACIAINDLTIPQPPPGVNRTRNIGEQLV
jgi:hypothetical protein